MAEGAAKERLGMVLENVGTLFDGNDFSINFTTLERGTLGLVNHKGMDIDSEQIAKTARSLEMSESFLGATVVAHEGSHELDSGRPGFNSRYYPSTGLERMLTEIRAYGLNSAMGNVMGISNGVNVPGMSLSDREKAIWDAAKRSWENACKNGGGGCSGYRP